MKAKTFRGRLWQYFALLTVLILGALWILQTVLLQSSYDGMVEKNVRSVAEQIKAHADDADFEAWLNTAAENNSLLILITDAQGQVLYATDEHNSVYAVQHATAKETNTNPYRQGEQSWQKGQAHYLSLPADYAAFLDAMNQSNAGTVSYESADGTAYIYGCRLGESIVYLSTALTAVGATVKIIRIQLLWVTVISLIAAFLLAWLLAKRFFAPIARISEQAKRLADGAFDSTGIKGFSVELDKLSDALERAAADITEARAYQKDFLANVSHDLRTPLTMIRGYAEMVRDISWQEKDKREADLGVIIRETDRLTALVNDIIDFSALDSGKLDMRMERFSMSELAVEITGQFASLCAQEGYTMQTDIQPDLFCTGDRKQLGRVLYNLIDNALTHAGEDKWVGVSVMLQDQNIHIAVSDHGSGIPEDILPHVWDRYFKTAQQKRNKKGSGLGLAICKTIIEQHGGSYGGRNDGGAVFWLEIAAK